MGSVIIMVLIALAAPSVLHAQSLHLTDPDRAALLEGKEYDIAWQEDGIDTVSITVSGTRTPLGTESRGEFTIPIATGIPATDDEYTWEAPWIDSVTFEIDIKGFDASGNQVAEDQREYGFRPAVLAGKMADGIYLDLHEQTHQRLYIERGGRIVNAYLSTSSRNYNWLPSDVHVDTPHDHAGVFHVLGKELMHWSALFQVEMPWALRYLKGHFIHATQPDQYFALGTPASSGCNRLTYEDAFELYESTPIGTRVEIIGPDG